MCAIYAVHHAHIWCSVPYHQHRTACITSTAPCTRYVIQCPTINTELTKLRALHGLHYGHVPLFKVLSTELTELCASHGLHYVHVLLLKVL